MSLIQKMVLGSVGLALAACAGAQQVYQTAPPGSAGNPIPTPMAEQGVVQTVPNGAMPPPNVVVPSGVVYVAPTYPAPAVGFMWSYHPVYGWGWYHPNRGWHRGWR